MGRVNIGDLKLRAMRLKYWWMEASSRGLKPAGSIFQLLFSALRAMIVQRISDWKTSG